MALPASGLGPPGVDALCGQLTKPAGLAAGGVESGVWEVPERDPGFLALELEPQEPGAAEAAGCLAYPQLQSGLPRVGVCAGGESGDPGCDKALGALTSRLCPPFVSTLHEIGRKTCDGMKTKNYCRDSTL